MNAGIFAKGSGTVSENTDGLTFEEYFQGHFRTIRNTKEELEEFADVDLYLLSSEFGYVRGNEFVDEASRYSNGKETDFVDSMVDALPKLDVVLIILPGSDFEEIITERWDEIAEAAKPGSIWCLATSESTLRYIREDKLTDKGCKVLTYHRVGVARLDQETRNRLIDIVSQ